MTETSASKIFDLRNFYYYQNNNIFTGSLKGFNYKIIPEKDKITVQTWHGNLCSELAEIEHNESFDMTQEGFDNMIAWLEDTYKKES